MHFHLVRSYDLLTCSNAKCIICYNVATIVNVGVVYVQSVVQLEHKDKLQCCNTIICDSVHHQIAQMLINAN